MDIIAEVRGRILLVESRLVQLHVLLKSLDLRLENIYRQKQNLFIIVSINLNLNQVHSSPYWNNGFKLISSYPKTNAALHSAYLKGYLMKAIPVPMTVFSDLLNNGRLITGNHPLQNKLLYRQLFQQVKSVSLIGVRKPLIQAVEN